MHPVRFRQAAAYGRLHAGEDAVSKTISTFLVLSLLMGMGEVAYGAVEVIGHRGAAGHAPENTLAAIQKAVEIGADRVEFDVRCSQEGEPVVIHDGTLDRTTNGKGKVSEATVAELKKLDAGSWFSQEFAGEPLPLLSELFEGFKEKIRFNVEVKASGCEEKILALIKDHDLLESAVVSSFHEEILQAFRRLHPKLKLQLITAQRVNLKPLHEELRLHAINPVFFLLSDKPFIQKARELGLKINVWTVDDEVLIKQALEAVVDGIISNYPDRVKAVLAT